jgi:hypothetical protein
MGVLPTTSIVMSLDTTLGGITDNSSALKYREDADLCIGYQAMNYPPEK